MNATVSNFVELTSGGAVSLTGNSGGSVITDGTANSPLAVVVNLGELGPSNSNSFVTLSVPVRLRSNVAYQLNMVSSVAGAGAVPGAAVAPALGGGAGLAASSVLASATDGHGAGSATLGAGLDLRVPAETAPGTYSALLTLTAIG